jgi:hypothetical protein
MKTRYWKYVKISRAECDSLEAAKRAAPPGYATHRHTVGQYVFRKRLPTHLIEARLAGSTCHWQVDNKIAPY